MRTNHHQAVGTHYLFFSGLFPAVHSLAFPCDQEGHVDMDEMSERALENYLNEDRSFLSGRHGRGKPMRGSCDRAGEKLS